MRLVVFERIVVLVSVFVFSTASMNAQSEQSILIGAKGGVPLDDPFVLTNANTFPNNYTFETRRYTAGPFFQLNLPLNLAVEVDALYKRLHYESNPFLFDALHASTNGDSWEFPAMLKHEFSVRSLHPFGGIGVSSRHVNGKTNFSINLLESRQPLELARKWNAGIAVTSGLDIPHGKLHLQPEIRYTRWTTRSFVSGNGLFNSNLNSIDLLIGVAFGK